MFKLTGNVEIAEAGEMGIDVRNVVRTSADASGYTHPTTAEVSDSDGARIVARRTEISEANARTAAEAKTRRRQARDAAIDLCFQRAPVTEEQPWGGHRLVWVSHEEQKCVDCGCYFSVPDVG